MEAVDPEVVDIDLNDPEVKDATLKIQAGFGRLMARKKQSNTAKSATPMVGDASVSKVEINRGSFTDGPCPAPVSLDLVFQSLFHIVGLNISTLEPLHVLS